MNIDTRDKFLEQELAELQVAAANFANRFMPDAKVRKDYIESTRRFSLELQAKLSRNQITLEVAARQAHSMRNTIMNAMRGRISDFGLALTRFMKKEGKTLQQLEAKYAHEIYKTDISRLNNY